MNTDTIVAIATAPGRGGIGIIRLSGPRALDIGQAITDRPLRPRYAHFSPFYGVDNSILDEGVAIYFAAPNSFTGEDCVELQGHGGPVVLDSILHTCIQHGARLAEPGEFSKRAYLNDKLDLAQAEAIADLIDATSRQSARNALNSLQGQFSERIHQLVDALTQLRIYVEAAIDFPEEEIDFLSDGNIASQLTAVRSSLENLLKDSQQGVLMREGIRVAIAGRPNAGKSSLLNALVERNAAIVTDIEGTTRDVLREYIQLDGMPLHLIDTAGLRSNPDEVERIGIERAQAEFAQADRILLVVDINREPDLSLEKIWPAFIGELPDTSKLTVVANKIDQSSEAPRIDPGPNYPRIYLSAQQGTGLDLLKQHLKSIAGYTGAGEGSFTARRRHLDALERAQDFLNKAERQLQYGAGELVAEDLRACQQALGEITGQVSADELLGKIFSSFCIGK